MMSIIGWIFTTVTLLYFTAAVLLVSVNLCGKYNIGGVPNTLKDRIIAVALITIMSFLWYLYVTNLPVAITMK